MKTTPESAERRENFPHMLRIATRWMDNDVYGHINNVVYYSYFDTVINKYLIEKGGLDIHRGEIIGFAVETNCRFLRPLAFPENIDAGLRITRIGSSSVRYEIGLFSEKEVEPAALGFFVHVFVDRETRRPTPLPSSLRDALTPLLQTAVAPA